MNTVKTATEEADVEQSRPKPRVIQSMRYREYTISIMEITPEVAADWLAHDNTHNRYLSMARAEIYARDMAADAWPFNGDAIRRTDTEVILDGQHRLKGIVDSGTTQEMLVVDGLPTSTQETMDIAGNRALADALHLRGEPNSIALAAVARRVCAYQLGVATGRARVWPTRAEMLAFLEDNTRARRAAEVSVRAAAARVPVAPSVIGSAYYLCSEKDETTAEVFYVTKIIDSLGLEEGEPAKVLIDRLKREKTDDGPMDAEMAFRYTLTAWNHFRTGATGMSRLQRPKGGWPAYSEMVIR
jgi:hypothetical protein